MHQCGWQLVWSLTLLCYVLSSKYRLFKHEGYCIWDYDTFSLMSTYREYIPNTCTKLYFPDDYGNTLYMNTRPVAKGDITIGVYTDDLCTNPSKLTLQEYIQMFYEIKGDSEQGQKVARAWTKGNTTCQWRE